MPPTTRALFASFICLAIACGASAKESKDAEKATDAEETPTVAVELAEGKLKVTAPEAWATVKPRNRLIEIELAVTGEDEDLPAARLTVMAAGGSVEQNIARWKGQFRQATGPGDAEEPVVDELEAAGKPLTVLDIAGTYLDSLRGPFGPKVEKPDHRMIAGILQTGEVGTYFFKLVGPTAVVDENAEAFREMLTSAEMPE